MGGSTTCHLNFFCTPNDLNDSFGRVIVSEDDIARQQIEEDLRLYGSRPEPSETVEVDELTQLANLPPKRSASEFEAAIDRPAKMRKKGTSKEFNYETLTLMDWNSGATPLDAWLNQSAVPSTTTALIQQESTKPEKDPLAQEIEEVKVFRNVHMATAPKPECKDPTLEHIKDLDFGAQIYYRNIMDRYPRIPIWLARRFAQANKDRAERLQLMREERKGPMSNELSPVDDRETILGQSFSPIPVTPPAILPPSSSDFWTGGSPKPRPTSRHSRSSSMNSSLRGSPKFDPQEQNPTFVNPYSATAACKTSTSPTLPPPPVELGKVLKFNCDICGKDINVKRRLEWQ